MENATVLTFEDWENGNWPPSALNIDQPFEQYLKDLDSQFRLFTLSDSEYQKIAHARDSIFEEKVTLFLKGQIDDFQIRFSRSLEKKSLVESELQNVNDRLQNTALSSPCVFPNPNGGTVIFYDVLEILQKEGRDPNGFPYWYKKLIVQGQDASRFIEPKHEKPGELPYPIAVHVLYRYRSFLEEQTLEANKQGQGGTGNALPQTFAEMFKEPDGEKWAITALEKAELVDNEQWEQGRTTGAIRAFFEALQDTGLIHEIDLTPGCKLIAKRFGVKVVKNYPPAKFTNDLRKELKAYLNYNRDNNRDGI